MKDHNNAMLLVELFENYGIDYIFCVPGASIDTILTALIGRKPKLILCRHEASAGHMAAAYAKKTGKPAVVLVTAGPGATNLVTAAATATLEHAALIAISGQMDSHTTFKPSHQVINAEMLFAPVTKYSKEVTQADCVVSIWDLAYEHATSGAPGAVHLAFPADLLAQTTTLSASMPPTANNRPEAKREDIANVQTLLRQAKYPVIVLGANAAKEDIANAIEKLMADGQIAAVCTFEGGGIIKAKNRESFMGRLGIFQNQPCNLLLEKTDLILSIGYNIAELDPIKWNKVNKPLIHIADYLPCIAEGYRPQVQLLGDIATNLNALADNLHYQPSQDYIDIQKQIRILLENRLHAYEPKENRVHPLYVIECIQALITDDDSLISDVGSHQYWIAEHFTSNKPRQFINSMGFQTMGVSLPFAIGVALANKKGKVYSVSGDGSFLMCMMELATAIELELPIIHFIWQDYGYNLVAIQEQHKYQATNAVHFKHPIDFVKIAEGFGAKGMKISAPDELPKAIKLAQKAKGPFVIEIAIDYSDNLKRLIEN